MDNIRNSKLVYRCDFCSFWSRYERCFHEHIKTHAKKSNAWNVFPMFPGKYKKYQQLISIPPLLRSGFVSRIGELKNLKHVANVKALETELKLRESQLRILNLQKKILNYILHDDDNELQNLKEKLQNETKIEEDLQTKHKDKLNEVTFIEDLINQENELTNA